MAPPLGAAGSHRDFTLNGIFDRRIELISHRSNFLPPGSDSTLSRNLHQPVLGKGDLDYLQFSHR